MLNESVNNFKIIAFTHKTIGIDAIGKLHLQDDLLHTCLAKAKQKFQIDELMYLSTCNRVEFLIITANNIDKKFLSEFLSTIYPDRSSSEIQNSVTNATLILSDQALGHLFNVASSIDSLVVGEREIITQVRNAYEKCNELGLTGDMLRLIVKRAIETAKQVYTETNVARNPVSVVSLAYRKLKELNVKLDARFLIIGSGITNTTMAKYLKKHGFKNFTVFNRTLVNAQKLASELSASAFSLTELKSFNQGFDVIVTCTGASHSIIDKATYKTLTGNDTSRKIIVDLAVPNDVDTEVLNSFDINLIAVNNLQEIATKNLAEREKELDKCRQLVANSIAGFRQVVKTRMIELAMSEVPKKVKEIHHTALSQVFAKDLENMDAQSKEVLEKILSYVEKKYISMPMKLAKEILSEKIKN